MHTTYSNVLIEFKVITEVQEVLRNTLFLIIEKVWLALLFYAQGIFASPPFHYCPESNVLCLI